MTNNNNPIDQSLIENQEITSTEQELVSDITADTMPLFNQSTNEDMQALSGIVPSKQEVLSQIAYSNPKDNTLKAIEGLGLQSKAYKKVVESQATVEAKYNLIKDRTIKKEYNIQGYNEYQVKSIIDGDTLVLVDKEGKEHKTRLTDRGFAFDTVESSHTKQNGTIIQPTEIIGQSKYKSKLQPSFVMGLVGKTIDQLTDADYQNVAMYQAEQVLNQMRPNGVFEKYDPSRAYTGAIINPDENIQLYGKSLGTDANNRQLMEIQNPITKRSVTHDVAMNPYLNVAFNLFNSVDNNKNFVRLNSEELKYKAMQTIMNTYGSDGDTRFGETIDMIVGSYYRSGANIANLFNGKTFNDIPVETLLSEDVGQQVIDTIAGISRNTRMDYIKSSEEAKQAFDNGDYLKSILINTTNFDRLVAESFLPTVIVAGTATAAAVAAPLIGTGAAIMLSIGAVSAVALDALAQDNTEYKQKNNNEDMPANNMLTSFAGHLLANGLDTLFPFLGKASNIIFGKTLSSAISKTITRKVAGAAETAAKHTVLGAATEFPSEYLDAVTSDITTNKDITLDSIKKAVTNNDNIYQGTVGATVGGGLGAHLSIISAPSQAVKAYKTDKYEKKVEKLAEERTVTSAKVNEEYTKRIEKILPTININKTSTEDVAKNLEILKELSKPYNNNIKTVEAVKAKRAEVLTNAILAGNEDIIEALEDKEETLQEIVYLSKSEDRAIKKLDTVAKNLGIKESKAKELLDINKVDLEAKFGTYGYYTYANNLKSIDEELTKPDVTVEQKEQLQKDRISIANSALYFYDSQLSKLKNIHLAIKQLQENKLNREVKFSYTSGSKYQENYIKRDDILDYSLSDRKGIFAIIAAAEGNANNLHSILNKYDISLDKKGLTEVIENIQTTINEMKEEVTNYRQRKAADKNNTFSYINRLEKLANKFILKPNENKTTLRRYIDTITDKQLTEAVDTFNKENKINIAELYQKELNARNNRKKQLVEAKIKADNKVKAEKIVKSIPIIETKSKEPIVSKELKTSKETTIQKDIDIDSINDTLQNIGDNNVYDSIKTSRNNITTNSIKRNTESSNKEIKQSTIDTNVIKDTLPEAIESILSNDSTIKDTNTLPRTIVAPNGNKGLINKLFTVPEVDKELQEEYNLLSDIIKEYKTMDIFKLSNEIKEDINSDIIRLKTIESELLYANKLNIINKIKDNIAIGKSRIIELQTDKIKLQETYKELKSNPLIPIYDIKTAQNAINDTEKEIKTIYKNDIFKQEQRILRLSNTFSGNAIKTIIADELKPHNTSNKDKAIILTNELTFSKNPTTLLGEYQINSNNKGVQQIIKALLSMLKVGNDPDNIYNRSKVQLKRSNESPAYALLFNDANIINPNVAIAIDYSVKELLLQSTYMFDSTSETNKELQNLKNQLTEIDVNIDDSLVLRTYMANVLGEKIFKNLGITQADTATNDYYNIVSNIGNIGLIYAEGNGYIKTHVIPITTNKIVDLESANKILLVESLLTNDNNKVIKASYDFLEPIRITYADENIPTPFPLKLKDTVNTYSNKGLTQVNAVSKEAMQKVMDTKFVVNESAADYILLHKKLIKKQMGFVDETIYNKWSKDAYVSQKSKNKAIEKQITDLETLHTSGNNGWYFNTFFSRNGRLNIKSSTVNMQSSGKQLHRFLITPASTATKIRYDGDIKPFYYFLAQAFGFKVDKKSDDKTTVFVKRILEIPYQDIETALTEDRLKDLEIPVDSLGNVENIGHFLAGIQALKQYQENLGKEDYFHSSLTAENDSTTSGYFIRRLQFPLSAMNKYDAKLGITTTKNNTAFHNIKDDKNFKDIYQTIASNIHVNTPVAAIKNNIFVQKYTAYGKPVPSETTQETKLKVWEKIYPLLPKLINNEVTPELRDLIKDPAMTFGYGQFKAGLSRNLGKNITESIINKFIDIQNNTSTLSEADKTSILELMSLLFENKSHNKIADILRNNLLINTYVPPITAGDNIKINVSTLLVDVISEGYGLEVYKVLENEFKSFLDINYYITYSFDIMFNIFITDYKNKIDEESKNKPITLKREQEIVKELFNKFPVIETVFSNRESALTLLQEGITIYDTAKVYGKGNNQVEFNKQYKIFKDKLTKSMKTTANIRVFKEDVTSGAVLPIHFIDGAGLAKLIVDADYDILPIHDAAVIGLDAAYKMPNDYNRIMYNINKDYDLFKVTLERLKTVVTESNAKDNKLTFNFDNKLKISTHAITNNNDFIKEMELVYVDIEKARNRFYNKEDMIINNTDGVEGSQFVLIDQKKKEEKFINDAFINALKDNTDIIHSDPFAYTTIEQITKLSVVSDGVLVDKDTRIEILNRLHANDINKNNISADHFKYLTKLISSIDTKQLENVIVQVGELSQRNRGEYVEYKRIPTKDINIGITTNYIRTSKSAAEIYGHELLHHTTKHVIEHAEDYKKTSTVKALQDLQKAAMEYIIPEDFLPANPTTDEILYAQAIWGSIFNNDNKNPYSGLYEFIAYGMTNEKVITKLKDKTLFDIRKKKSVSVNILDKLLQLVHNLLEALAGNIPFHLIASEHVYRNLYDHLNVLVSDLNRVDKSMLEKLATSPYAAVEIVFKLISNAKDVGDKYLSPIVKQLFDIAGLFNVSVPVITPDMTVWEQAIWVVKYVPLILLSKTHRQAIPLVMKSIGLSYQGTIQSIYNDLMQPDKDTNTLEALGLQAKKVEQASKLIESTVYKNLLDSFKAELTDLETTSLMKSTLQTDLQILLDEYSIQEIKKLLTDTKILNTEINELKIKLDGDINKNWYIGSSMLLAKFMTTGRGNEALALNAYDIAKGFNTGSIMYASEDTINIIDKLTTLYAIQNTDTIHRLTTASLADKGLINFIKAHQIFVQESKTELINRSHIVKGYTKQIFDDTNELVVDELSKQAEYLANGYKIISTISNSKITGKSKLVLYRSSFDNTRRRDGASFLLNGQHTFGTSLDTISKNDVNIDTDTVNLQSAYLQKANSIRYDLVKYISAVGENINFDRIDKITDNFIPIIKQSGEIRDYRISMIHINKEQILKQELNGIKILSKMYASKTLKLQAKDKNTEIAQYLLKDMIKNLLIPYSTIGKNSKEYVKIEEVSNNTFVRKVYKILPKELKTVIGNSKKGMYIREDWLQTLFGVPQMSVIDLKSVNEYAPNFMKHIIKIAESIIKHVAYFAKQNVVLRIPKVLISNIISNMLYSVINGTNLLTVIKMQIANTQHLRDYLDKRKELNAVIFKEKLGTATTIEIKQKNWYKNRLESNPLHVLMEKGMYQAIIEDIAMDELDATGKIGKFLKKKIGNKVPKLVKTIGKHAYMLEGTPIFEFIRKATQYSDFVARATEYQIQMKKAPIDVKARARYEENVSHRIMDAFINYDKPSAALEQYLNDMGLVMFTKFAKRILRVIVQSFTEHPVSSLAFLFGQAFYFDAAVGNTFSDDIFEQFPTQKDYSLLFHNPIDNAISTMVPAVIKAGMWVDKNM